MITTEKYLTELTASQRVALETLLAEQLDCAAYAPPGEFAPIHELLDLEHVGLLTYDLKTGEQVTPKGRALVVELAHADAMAGAR